MTPPKNALDQTTPKPDLPYRRALVLGAHTDDEFGCSGTIARLIDQGTEVHYAVFSTCAESLPPGFPVDALDREVRRATRVLGIPEHRLYVKNYPVRHFPTHRQSILEEMVVLRKQVAPDLVLLPALSDVHQDHQVIAQEGRRAFKGRSVLGYELPMNTISFRHACFVAISHDQLQRKIDSMSQYETQKGRPYMNEEFLRGLAKVRGVQAGAELAEAFEAIRVLF